MKRGIRIVASRHDLDSAMLPRPYSWFHGDLNNNHLVLLGVDLRAACTDPLLSVGLEIGAAPESIVGRLLDRIRTRRGL